LYTIEGYGKNIWCVLSNSVWRNKEEYLSTSTKPRKLVDPLIDSLLSYFDAQSVWDARPAFLRNRWTENSLHIMHARMLVYH
jgi:hypothetical protein